MKGRPHTIAVIGCLFIATGCVGLVAGLLPSMDAIASRHAARLDAHELVDGVLVTVSSLLAVLGGAFLLRGCYWARWLLVAWMTFHIGLSALHSPFRLVVHGLLFGAVLFLLFRPTASAYFRGARAEPSSSPQTDGNRGA